jgi:hypothetical protein
VIPPELYGPFGALVILGVVLTMLVRGDLVPGFIYKAAVARAEKSDIQAERTADALTALAKAVSDGAAIHGAPKDG